MQTFELHSYAYENSARSRKAEQRRQRLQQKRNNLRNKTATVA